MVKLQKHKAYTYKADNGKKIEHFKHLVVLPEGTVSQVGWSEGTDLNVSVAKNSIVLTPKKEDDEEE